MRKRTAIIAAIVVTAILMVAFFPYHYIIEPSVKVLNVSSSASLSGDFSSLDSNGLNFNSTVSSARIISTANATSFLNLTSKENLFYSGGYTPQVMTTAIIKISGSLFSNLDPTGLVLTVNATDNTTLSHIMVYENVYANSLWNNSRNTSMPNHINMYFIKSNHSSVSENVKLLNKPAWLPFRGYNSEYYNFSYYTAVVITQFNLSGYGGTHYFGISVRLLGLKEIPVASINLAITNN